MDNPKILIIRLSSIGDIVLTTPVIRCLKVQKPNAEIHFLTKECNAIILRNNPYIDNIYTVERSVTEIISLLRKERYDFVLDLHRLPITHYLRVILNRPYSYFQKLNIRKWLLVNFKINKMPNHLHIVDRYIDAAEPLGIINDDKGLDYFLKEEDNISIEALPISFHNGYIVIVVGSKHNTKQMTIDMLEKICQGIKKPIILLGDKNDRKKAIKIENAVGAKVFNSCGAYNLNQSASLIKNSIGVITPDTGLMHVAAALNKNIISVWGNTVPEFGMYPYMPKDSKSEVHIIENKNLKCRPCSKLGFSKCPKRHFNCMKGLDIEQIISIANSWSTK